MTPPATDVQTIPADAPTGSGAVAEPLRLLVEPGLIPLVRLMAGERELARIASPDPAAPHVRLGLRALARSRAPELAGEIAAALGGD